MRISLAAPEARFPTQTWRHIITGVLSGLVVLSAAPAASAVWRGGRSSFGLPRSLHIWFVETFHLEGGPTTNDLLAVARQAETAHQVSVPAPLRTSCRGDQLLRPPSAAHGGQSVPQVATIDHLLRIALVDRRTLTAANSPRAFMFRIGGLRRRLHALDHGHQVVIVMHSLATQKELANIKRTMTAAALQR